MAMTVCGFLCSFAIVEIISYRIAMQHELIIKALGKKQGNSKGREVWLIGHRHDFHDVLNISDLQFGSGWQFRGRDVVTLRASSSIAKWKGKIHTNGSLTFLTHQYSGKVEVTWDGEPEIYDLYSSKRGTLTVDLEKIQNICDWYLLEGVFTLLFTLFFVMLSMVFFSKSCETYAG